MGGGKKGKGRPNPAANPVHAAPKAGTKTLKTFEKREDLPYTLYVDMDGVIVDFEGKASLIRGGVERLFGKPFRSIPKNDMWRTIANARDFWRRLDWLPDGRELWDYVQPYHPIILTSPGNGAVARSAAEQKVQWAAAECHTDRIITEMNKAIYARPDAILIDDMEKNTVPWSRAGGLAILHERSQATIEQLKLYLPEDQFRQ